MSRLAGGRLHVITDETVQSRFSHVELAAMAAEGGADIVQFREKRGWETAALVRVARRMRERLAGSGTRLIVNDRADVAVAAGADGVHVGPDDLEAGWARRLLGEQALVGGTANDLERALDAAREPVDYLGVGPVFGTGSKADPAPTLGLDGLRRIVRAVDRPVVAIGNVTADRVAGILETGAHGVAVLAAVVARPDPVGQVAALVEAIAAAAGRSPRA